MRGVTAVVALVMLAGCEEPGPADFASTCQGYGFRAGTDAMASCVQQESLGYHQRLGSAMQSAIFAGQQERSLQLQRSQSIINAGRGGFVPIYPTFP